MSESSRKPPWGDAKAVIERDRKTVWITLGPVWETEAGALSFTLESEPLAWRDPRCARRVVIMKRDADTGLGMVALTELDNLWRALGRAQHIDVCNLDNKETYTRAEVHELMRRAAQEVARHILHQSGIRTAQALDELVDEVPS